MNDSIWILGLLIILGITLFIMFTLPLLVAVYGYDCIEYNSTNLLIVSDKGFNPLTKGNCYNEVNDILGANNIPFSYENVNGIYERWIFIK